jgi:hypothetical protein
MGNTNDLKQRCLAKLERIEPAEAKMEDDELFDQMKFEQSLLLLAKIDHEKEYELCRRVAMHLLGEIPDPEPIDLTE